MIVRRLVCIIICRLPTQDGLISCPFDRQQTLLGNNGVWELNKNFALMEMIERVQIQESADTCLSYQWLERLKGCSGLILGNLKLGS